MNKKIKLAILVFIDLIWFILGAIFKEQYHTAVSLGMIVFAVISYFYIVYKVDNGNVISLKAIFTGMWMGTIGLANLKLLGYQVPWQTETWLILGGTLLAFHIGFFFMENFGNSIYRRIKQKASGLFRRLHFPICESRLFTICVIVGLVGLGSFIMNVLIKGYIPFFVTDDTSSYVNFYTRFYIFAVAAIACAGLCIYVLKTQKPGKLKSAILILIIIYEVILMPLLIVSRGTQMIAILIMSVPLVMLSKRKFLIFICCMILAFSLYEVGSIARNYSNEYLNAIFQPKEVSLSVGQTTDSADTQNEGQNLTEKQTDTTAEQNFTETQTNISDSNSKTTTFTLSPSASFLYSYLTVSHDNFNEAVSHNAGGTSYGLHQISPFTVILRFPALREKIDSLNFYQITPTFTTGNLITYAYYDFGAIGCCLFMLFWSCIFSCIEQFALRKRGPFSMLVLGVTLVPIILSFFDCWLSNFTIWLLWGTIFLMFLGATLKPRRKQNKS